MNPRISINIDTTALSKAIQDIEDALDCVQAALNNLTVTAAPATSSQNVISSMVARNASKWRDYKEWSGSGNVFWNGNTVRMNTNSDDCGIYTTLPSQPAGWYVIEADVELLFGFWTGAGAHVNFGNGSTASVDFSTDADTSGTVSHHNNCRRKFAKMVFNGGQGATPSLYAMGNWDGFALKRTKGIVWHDLRLRPATLGEVSFHSIGRHV